jgi:hypothetical protein
MKKIILILFLLLISCGSRKVAVSNIDNKRDSTAIKTTDTIVETKVEAKDSTNIKVNTEEYEISLTPIDTSKEIVYNGQRVKNAVLRLKKIKSNTLYTNVNKVSKNDSIAIKTSNTVAIKDTKKESTKNIDKKESVTFNVIFFFSGLLIALIIILIVRKMYKEYIG